MGNDNVFIKHLWRMANGLVIVYNNGQMYTSVFDENGGKFVNKCIWLGI